MLLQLKSPGGICAGLVIERGVAVSTAPILKRFKGWSETAIRKECARIKWSITQVEEVYT